MPELKVKELSFKGHTYKICYTENYPQDASWFSHDDESSVRDRDWDIKPGDVVFDIGSAYGSYALTALACGAKEVFCWNPNNDENDTLMASARANDWEHRISLIRSGLWSSTGWLRDTDLQFTGDKDAVQEGQFAVWSLDELVGVVHSRLDWIKMDVEGAEVEVLKGAEQTIKRFKPRILVEVHLFKDGTLGTRTTELLESYGYRKVSEHAYHAVAHALYEPA